MTFSISARCARSGMFGIAVSSSSICVASRCGVWARAGAGVVATQNVTDPRLGAIGLDLLASGHSAQSAIAQMAASNAHPEYRQIAAVDQDGGTGHYSGAKTLGLNRVVEGCGCVAAGNILSAEEVPAMMVEAFEAAPDSHLAERLLAGLEAGLAAGGEEGDVRSAGLYVVHRHVFPIVDLRVDWHAAPIGELRRVWQLYEPEMNAYITRAVDPDKAPSYGVPGDM
ncbi:MAG: DUF1028 domain-containing protein [Alphaproteobacteria bacterium]